MVVSVVQNKSIIKTQKAAINDTFNFENCTYFDEYNYDKENKKLENPLGLCLPSNYVLSTIIPYLKKDTEPTVFDYLEAEKFYGKPMALSYHLYGRIDAWWIILALNGFFNARDFTGWNRLLLPDISKIFTVFDKEVYGNKDVKFGIIPEIKH